MDAQRVEFLTLLKNQVQYVIPRWQRRYRWGQTDIERLVEDLLAIVEAEPDRSHYGGTLITFQEPQPAGVVNSIRVVDGQQRLTTVSLLVAAIAEHLGPEGTCGDWNQRLLVDVLLLNQSADRRRKLRLQNRDEDEYRQCLETGSADGAGAVAQAYKLIQRLVRRYPVEALMRGLERFRVVSIGLESTDDPQQIFQSINATGHPLTESEKVKNSLLLGLPDAVQQKIHDTHWRAIEDALDAHRSSDPIDLFLRDFLRWQTGEVYGIGQVYERFRRWTLRTGSDSDRTALAERLARLARHYGMLMGTEGAGRHADRDVERELVHLRALGLETHRPFTLRLLNDEDQETVSCVDVARTLALVSTWLTRTWLADQSQNGLNRTFADWAKRSGPEEGEDIVGYWNGQLHRLRNTRVAVPTDEEVRHGIANRKAYGGNVSQSSLAVLCRMMEDDRPDESPDRKQLTIEHVLPRKLTPEWREELGFDAEELHNRWCNRLANLTLSGNQENPRLGNMPFEKKKTRYRRSPIWLTRNLAEEEKWNEDALERRAETLALRALHLWPWQARDSDPALASSQAVKFEWRIEQEESREEIAAMPLLLNVVSALIEHDPDNIQRLTEDPGTSGVYPEKALSDEDRVSSLRYRPVPGHSRWLVDVYSGREEAAERCRQMGNICGVDLDVTVYSNEDSRRFWQAVQKETGGLIGQKGSWRGHRQWTGPLTPEGDEIVFWAGRPQEIFLYVFAGKHRAPEDRIKAIRDISWRMEGEMEDQNRRHDPERQAEDKGHSILIVREWDRDDEDQWPEVARWLQDQQNRVKSILEDVVCNGEASVPT